MLQRSTGGASGDPTPSHRLSQDASPGAGYRGASREASEVDEWAQQGDGSLRASIGGARWKIEKSGISEMPYLLIFPSGLGLFCASQEQAKEQAAIWTSEGEP